MEHEMETPVELRVIKGLLKCNLRGNDKQTSIGS